MGKDWSNVMPADNSIFFFCYFIVELCSTKGNKINNMYFQCMARGFKMRLRPRTEACGIVDAGKWKEMQIDGESGPG